MIESVGVNKETKTESAVQLDDEQIRQFICDGVLVLESDGNERFHQDICERIDRIHRNNGQTGNNGWGTRFISMRSMRSCSLISILSLSKTC